MSESEFVFEIEGPDVKPETVDVRQLSDVLGALIRSLESENETVGSVASLGLVQVEEGSDSLTFHASSASLSAAERITSALSARRYDSLNPKTRSHLQSLADIARRNNWTSYRFKGNGSSVGYASLHPSDQIEPVETTYSGETVIYATCEKVGGTKRPSASLKLLDGTRIESARIDSKPLAQKLAKRLYESVGLRGTGTWNFSTGKLLAFTIEDLTEYEDKTASGEKKTFRDALDGLYAASEGRWEGVDIDDHFNALRDD